MIHLSHTVLNIYLSQFRSGDHFVLTHTWFLSEYLWVFFFTQCITELPGTFRQGSEFKSSCWSNILQKYMVLSLALITYIAKLSLNKALSFLSTGWFQELIQGSVNLVELLSSQSD